MISHDRDFFARDCRRGKATKSEKRDSSTFTEHSNLSRPVVHDVPLSPHPGRHERGPVRVALGGRERGSAAYASSLFFLLLKRRFRRTRQPPHARVDGDEVVRALRKPGYDALVLFVMEENATDDSSG